MNRWLGIDSGESEHVMVLLDEDGNRSKSERVDNSATAIEQRLRRIVAQTPGRVQIMLESRRSVGAVVTEVALSLGMDVHASGKHALEKFRSTEGQLRKSDDRDAYLLARLGFQGFGAVRAIVEIGEGERELCRLTRLHRRCSEDHGRLLNRMRSCLVELSPALVSEQAPDYSSKRVRAVLKRWPALKGLDRAHRKTVERELVWSRNREEEAEFLRQAASEVVLSESEREVVELELGYLIQQLDIIEASIRELDKRIEELVSQHPEGSKLLEVPGIGPFIAGVIVGELLPVVRHATEPQAATYSGLTPLCRKSGKSDKSSRSKRVNKNLLRAHYLSATAARPVSAIDKAYYDKKLKDFAGHPRPHVKATLALARQRHKMIFKLLTTEQRYDKEVLIRSHLERKDAA